MAGSLSTSRQLVVLHYAADDSGLDLVLESMRRLSEAAHVLMEGTLAHVDVGSSRDDIEAIDHVDSVHEIHA